MPITERVKMLRQQSLNAKETLSSERAELLTAFYQQETGLLSAPVRRAKAFAYMLEHKHIEIYPGELIVGEKGNCAQDRADLPGVVLSHPAGSRHPEHAAKRPPSTSNPPRARLTRKPSSPTGTANRCAS